MKSRRFPGFEKCLAMMRSRNPLVREEGFGLLMPAATHLVPELIAAFRSESDHGLRCWLLELVGEAKSVEAFDLLSEQLASDDDSYRDWAIRGLQTLDTKEARELLYRAGQK